MKRAIRFKWCIIILFTATNVSFAQPKFGARAGVLTSTIISKEYTEDYRLGFEAGGLAEFKINKRFSTLTELSYALKGHQVESAKLNLQYLSLSALPDFKLTRWMDIFLGPSLQYLIDAGFTEKTVSSLGYFHKINVEAIFGIRFFEVKNWGFDVRVNYGLSKLMLPLYLRGVTYWDFKNTNNPHNLSFQLGTFYTFKRKSK